MSLYEILSIVTCLTSTITMIIVGVAVLPHFKNGLAIVRDAVLWASLLALLAFVGWLGLRQLANYRAASESKTAEVKSLRALSEPGARRSTENLRSAALHATTKQ